MTRQGATIVTPPWPILSRNLTQRRAWREGGPFILRTVPKCSTGTVRI